MRIRSDEGDVNAASKHHVRQNNGCEVREAEQKGWMLAHGAPLYPSCDAPLWRRLERRILARVDMQGLPRPTLYRLGSF